MQVAKIHPVPARKILAVTGRTLTWSRLLSGSKRGSTAIQSKSEGNKLACASDVRRYARQQLEAEVDVKKPDAYINLAKACMLIALEEEAAIEDDVLHSRNEELAWLRGLSTDVQQQDELEDVELSLVNRDIGTASSWSLSRLDALADEVKTCFLEQHMPQAVSHNASDQITKPEDAALLDRQASVHSTSSASEDAALLERQASNSYTDSITGSSQETPTVRFWKSWLAWAVGRFRGINQRPPHQQPRKDKPLKLDSVVTAMQQYPMQTVAAINTVLYEQHGYNRMHLHGNPRDAQLSSVLDNGAGTPAALAVLYMEVARRLGSPMVALMLEGGRQCMIWPEHGGLSAQGEDFVIDPYSQGALYSQAEVAELFDLDLSQTSLQAASKREILAAMLAAVRDSYWCKAAACHPEPALMTPITVQVAASGTVQPMDGFYINRALAAAEARAILLPEAREVQLEHALLLYFAGQHANAIEELEHYKTGCAGREGAEVDVLLSKLIYIKTEKTNW